MNDREMIQDLLSEYNVAVDALDIDGWAACFTADGVFDGALETFRAHQDKAKFAAHAAELEAQGMPRLRHFLSNIRIEVDGTRGHSHCFFMIAATPDGQPSFLSMVGEYDDDLAKIDGRWLFTRRTVSTDGTQYQRQSAS
jgi:3-phenylpropionate/cinnamic acid dioxygenase small subunit